jgi:hypothetical protein
LANLFQLSKIINAESRSLMESKSTGYVPIMACIDYAGTVTQVLEHGLPSLDLTTSTIFAALATFMNLHYHLHLNSRTPDVLGDEEPFIDRGTAFIYGYLRQALLIYTRASASVVQRLGGGTRKNQACFE